MEIVLTKDVKGLGRAGEKKVVEYGYGMNYLIPRGLATSSTDSLGENAKHKKETDEVKNEILKEKEQEMLDNLPLEITIKENINNRGVLFNSVNKKTIASELGIKEDWVDMEPIKEVGEYTIDVKGKMVKLIIESV